VAEIELTAPFDPSAVAVGLHRDGSIRAIPASSGPPRRIDGLTIGWARMARPAPHAGELHPDGDELLVLVSGAASVVFLGDGGEERSVELAAGQAIVVPRGVWHRVIPKGTIDLIHVTPGPRGDWRPLPSKP
jgi:mannose-6-phosphate isomerase-like protein (cupin superfamily)